MKIGLVTPYIYPLLRRSQRARGAALREPHRTWPRRAHHHQRARAAAPQRRRCHPLGLRLLRARQRLYGHAHHRPALYAHDPGHARAGEVRRAAFSRAVRALPVADGAARVEEREHRDLPRICRLESCLRVRPAHAATFRPPARRTHRRQRGRAPLHRVVLPGRLQGHPQRRRPAPLPERPAVRPLPRWHAQHPVSGPVREPQGPDLPAEGIPRAQEARLRLPPAGNRLRARRSARCAATSPHAV